VHTSIVHPSVAIDRRMKGHSGIFQSFGALLRPCSGGRADTRSMADFLAVLGIIGFVVVFLGLIWALDRV
jgi:hypothetical protein